MKTLLAALLLAVQATAPPAIRPVGDKPSYRAQDSPFCANWRSARSGAAEGSTILAGAYRLWVLGYVSGFNIYGPDPTGDLLGSANWDEIAAFVDDHCARNPSHAVVDAMRPLAVHRLRQRPEPTRRPASGAPVRKRAQVVLAVSCADWKELPGNRILRNAHLFGVGGFLTAYNLWGPDPAGDVIGSGDPQVAERWIDDWCRDRTSELVIGAIQPLIAHLATERAAGRLPPAGMRPVDRLSPGSRD